MAVDEACAQQFQTDGELVALARRAGFDPLSQAELAVLRATPTGNHAVCGSSGDPKNPSNDPSKSDEWDSQRELRAGLLEWLATTPDAAKRVHRTGLFIRGGKITGELNLANLTVPFPLTLNQCRLTGRTCMIGSHINFLHLAGCWIHSLRAEEATIGGSVWLTDGFVVEHGVHLIGAEIKGDLACRGGTFRNPRQDDDPRSGCPLNAERIRVGGTLFLDGGFTAHGEVRLLGAKIGSDLICNGGTFGNPRQENSPESGNALSGDGADVAGSVSLGQGFRAEGAVRLSGAQIGRQLDCAGGTFKNAIPDGKALLAERATINGSTFLSQDFSAEGEIRLLGAHIGGDLDCSGGKFIGLAQTGNAMRAERANINGSVLLRNGFSATGEVRLEGMQVGGDIECSRGRFENPLREEVRESGVALRADRVVVRGGILLNKDFVAEGAVRLLNSQIRGNLDCSGGTFRNLAEGSQPGSGLALVADFSDVAGSIFFRDGFNAEGLVRLPGVKIGADLDCNDGIFKNCARPGAPNSGIALGADRAKVAGSIRLNRSFHAEGEVRFPGANIGCDLDCRGGKFLNLTEKRGGPGSKALNAEGACVNRHVYLDDSFLANGEVSLKSAQVGGDLYAGGTFITPQQDDLPDSPKALNLDSGSVKGTVSLNRVFATDGEVWLCAAHIDRHLECRESKVARLTAEGVVVGGNLVLAGSQSGTEVTIKLTNASVGSLVDEEATWPAPGNLYLDGFIYRHISSMSTDAVKRLDWLARQSQFRPQPYRQLAKILREMGHDREARRVLYEMERLRRDKEGTSFFDRLWTGLSGLVSDRTAGFRGWVLKWTIGYGIYPLRVVWWLVGFVLSGTMLFHFGYAVRSMAPTDEKAYTYFKQFQSPPIYYQRFNSFIYSLENSVPVLKLGQDIAWSPDPAPRRSTLLSLTSPTLLRFFRWSQIVVGWILVTLFLAGVTGIVRKD